MISSTYLRQDEQACYKLTLRCNVWMLFSEMSVAKMFCPFLYWLIFRITMIHIWMFICNKWTNSYLVVLQGHGRSGRHYHWCLACKHRCTDLQRAQPYRCSDTDCSDRSSAPPDRPPVPSLGGVSSARHMAPLWPVHTVASTRNMTPSCKFSILYMFKYISVSAHMFRMS